MTSAPAATEPPSFDEIRPRARGVLEQALANETGWNKIQAAEELLKLGYRSGVGEAFAKELKLDGHVPEIRIGILRVLALEATPSGEVSPWAEHIMDVFLNPAAPDRSHALETLAKLSVAFDPEQLAVVREYAEDMRSPFAFWILARHGEEGARERLEEQQGDQDATRRSQASYSLEQLDPESRESWRARGGPQESALALAHPVAAVRAEACRDFGRFGMPEEAAHLLPLLEDPDAAVRIQAASALLRLERRVIRRLAAVDWLVIAGYALGMLWIGWHYKRRTSTSDDYLLGGRRMKPWMVGLSLFATLLSVVSYMAYPGEMIKHGPMIFAGLLSVPLIILVVGWWFIPAFMRQRVTSANEILESNLGSGIRTLGGVLFLTLRLVWMAVVIHITAKAVLGPVFNLPPSAFPFACAVLGAITVIYTSSGGLRAVVLTDVIQTFVLFLGAILAILLITVHFGGFSWFPSEWPATWDQPAIWFDSEARVTFAGAMTMFFFWHVCTAGSDQMAVQRFLATKDIRSARFAFGTSMIANVLVGCLLALLGLALVQFFIANPHQFADGMNLREHADRIFPSFIASGLPVGIKGLVIAALLAAAMSSLSSGLNSACTIITVDFLDVFGEAPTGEPDRIRRARFVSWMLGGVIIALSLLVGRLEGNFMEVVSKAGNLLVAPLFLLFFMAMFVPRANAIGAWTGVAASVTAAVAIAFHGIFGLSFIWIIPGSLVCGLAVGWPASLVTGGWRPQRTT